MIPTGVTRLRWCDVDPSTHPFADVGLLAAVERRVEAAVSPKVRPSLVELQASIDRHIVATHGAWSAGWRWAASEPGGGGPVRGWCCASHSLLRDGEPSRATAARVHAAVLEWRAFLDQLAAVFTQLHAATAGQAVAPAAEHAAARLLPMVVDRTSADDAWYSTFAVIMSWYLESTGMDGDRIRPIVGALARKRFDSWCAPADELVGTACAELGDAVATAVESPVAAIDALAAWRAIREVGFAAFDADPSLEPVEHDGHRRYIERRERLRDKRRADRMAAALDVCRKSARRDQPLTLERLVAWQKVVLGDRAVLRQSDAYGKGGRERYPMIADLDGQLRHALSQANDGEPVAVRAARAYLDVCFFHPFVDGNARAARLAMDHVLTRAGLGLHAVEPLIVVSRAADDANGAWYLAYLISYLSGPIAPR